MRSLFSLFLLSFLFVSSISSQGIEFFHGTWEEALLKAKDSDKIIFVDCYTTWCGPCRNMANRTFPDPEVGELFNTNFISMKIDMEQEMGRGFAKKFPVSAYPTLYFIDGSEEVIHKVVGAKTPPDLISIANGILEKHDKSHKYAALYEAGDRSYDLMYKYVSALNKSGKPTNKIVNEYLASKPEITSEQHLRFLLEAASQVDCTCFEEFEKNKAAIIKLTSADEVDEHIRTAAVNSVKRAIEFESPELITQAVTVMKKHLPKEAEFFASQSDIEYSLKMQLLEGIADKAEKHVKKFIKEDPVLLHQIALDLEKYAANDAEALKQAALAAGKAAESSDVKYTMTYARLTNKVYGKDAAIKILDAAMAKINDPEDKNYVSLHALKNKIQNG